MQLFVSSSTTLKWKELFLQWRKAALINFYTTATTICTTNLWKNINNKNLWKGNTLANIWIITMFSNINQSSAQNVLTFRSISLLPPQIRSLPKPYRGSQYIYLINTVICCSHCSNNFSFQFSTEEFQYGPISSQHERQIFFIPKLNKPPSEVIITSNIQATMKQKNQHFHSREVR